MYKSFCLRQRAGNFDLANRDQLWNLLVQITLCKARNTATRHIQGKRDVAGRSNVRPAAAMRTRMPQSSIRSIPTVPPR